MEQTEWLKFRKAQQVYKTLCNKITIRIIDLLQHEQTLKVSEIFQKLQLTQSQVSQQLSKLRKLKIVNCKRQKNIVFYNINTPRFQELLSITTNIF